MDEEFLHKIRHCIHSRGRFMAYHLHCSHTHGSMPSSFISFSCPCSSSGYTRKRVRERVTSIFALLASLSLLALRINAIEDGWKNASCNCHARESDI